MLISLSRQQILLMNAKAASHTLRAVIGAKLEWCCLGRPFDARDHHSARIPVQYQHFETFVVVRNPYSRAVSHWAHDTKTGGIPPCTFDEYVRRNVRDPILGLMTQSQWLRHVRVDRVIHFETMRGELRSHGLLSVHDELPKLNASEHDAWDSYYTPDLAALVYGWYRLDFSLYGYFKDLNAPDV